MEKITEMDSLVCSGLKITNIKFSFCVEKTVQVDETDCLVYYKRNNLIVKHSFFTCSILGKKRTHVNITGVKNFEQINKAVDVLINVSNITRDQITGFKIDNISATFETFPGLKSQIICSNDSNISVFKPVKFCGLILKINKKYSCTYFNSGKIIYVGAKSIETLNEVYNLFKDYFYRINLTV